MIVRKGMSLKAIFVFAGHHLPWLTGWMTLVTVAHYFLGDNWPNIPWLPLSVIGTAVAFYVGFKNNQAYDRVWEARKIWGSIVNSSRMWGVMVKAYVVNDKIPEQELVAIRKQLIYRQIGWTYKLREQLLVPAQWEHVNLKGMFGRFSRNRQKRFGTGAFQSQVDEVNLGKYISEEEQKENSAYANAATHIIDKQSQILSQLHKQGLISHFRQIELQKILNDFYESQGQAERIKRFPLPRQYGSLSFIFVCIFIFLLPFGVAGEFNKLGSWGLWMSIPFGVLMGWVYVVMELIGDYSENPFEGLPHDIPMFSICRTIEIDLLQMLDEKNIPAPVKPIHHILM